MRRALHNLTGPLYRPTWYISRCRDNVAVSMSSVELCLFSCFGSQCVSQFCCHTGNAEDFHGHKLSLPATFGNKPVVFLESFSTSSYPHPRAGGHTGSNGGFTHSTAPPTYKKELYRASPQENHQPTAGRACTGAPFWQLCVSLARHRRLGRRLRPDASNHRFMGGRGVGGVVLSIVSHRTHRDVVLRLSTLRDRDLGESVAGDIILGPRWNYWLWGPC
ncbi:hypothetical protein F4775DRAFT_464639 [Biscogniauxia sp. FL1348]|nr:hypothetical protein F4775DRAFT_464639 [Biscogniauxia sp. FL1348]